MAQSDWTINRGPGFLAVVWFGSSTTPPPASPLLSVSLNSETQEGNYRWQEGGGGSQTRRPQSMALYKSFNTLWDGWSSDGIPSLALHVNLQIGRQLPSTMKIQGKISIRESAVRRQPDISTATYSWRSALNLQLVYQLPRYEEEEKTNDQTSTLPPAMMRWVTGLLHCHLQLIIRIFF
jgi:hypothetical protein